MAVSISLCGTVIVKVNYCCETPRAITRLKFCNLRFFVSNTDLSSVIYDVAIEYGGQVRLQCNSDCVFIYMEKR